MAPFALSLIQILAAATLTSALPARPQPCTYCCSPQLPGINLAWNNCLGVANAADNVSYACDGSRVGQPFRAVFSFISPATMDQFVGIQAVIDVTTGAAPLPDWWALGTGECRDGNFVFPASFTGIGDATCLNPWTGSKTGGGFAYYFENTGADPRPGYGRIKFALARDTEAHLDAGQHYLAGVMLIDNLGDVDLGDGLICGGCTQGASLAISSISLYQTVGAPPQDIYQLCQPGAHSTVTWQGGIVPVRNRTWGSIKALYR